MRPVRNARNGSTQENCVKTKTEREKKARRAYDNAYGRECYAIPAVVRETARHATASHDIRKIHNYLSEKRIETDNKYRYSVLITVFGRLLAEGWLFTEYLNGLSNDKVADIGRIARYLRGSFESASPDEDGDDGEATQ